MRRSPARSGSGLARKRRHSINSSARTRRPGANIKMSDHSMLGGARTGGEFHPAQFYSMPTNATNCGRCFSEKDLYGYRQGAISVTTGPPPLDARTRRRSLRLLGPKSLEYGLRFDCPRIESVATDSLMDKPLGIDSTRGCAVRSSTRMQELLPACRLRS